MGLGNVTYLTYASGGTFSQYSHEYQVLLPQGEDTIYISEEAEKRGLRVAVNKEIYEEGVTVCPVTGGTTFRAAQASEAGNIFQLGTKFSTAFELKYTAQDGSVQDVIMGCYGIGISRLMGIVAEAMSDDAGLVWPTFIAPAQIIISPLAKKKEEESFTRALELKHQLEASGTTVILDDRIDQSVGSRLADADLLGIPFRALLSPKTLERKVIEMKDRQTGEVNMLKTEEFVNFVKQ